MDPHLMSLQETIQYVFYGLISFIAAWGVAVLAGMKSSIETLNVKIAIVIERSDQHDKILDKHDSRLSKLEDT